MINIIAENIKKAKLNYYNLIQIIEEKNICKSNIKPVEKKSLNPGDIVRIGYKIPEGDKERIQYYEGLIISIQNRGISKTFKVRRIVQGIGVEQTFLLNSPKITLLSRKQSSKIRRAKLYFIRRLKGKAARLKSI